MRTRVVAGLAALLAMGSVWFHFALWQRPSLDAFASHFVATGPLLSPKPDATGTPVTLIWLGVSTLLIDDGETALMTDGFFSRPPLLRSALFGGVTPDLAAIDAGLARVDLSRLAAVMTVHSHYDHSMDAPEVAKRTGARLVGSESTLNVGRGWGLDEAQLQRIDPGVPLAFGAFRVTFVESRHVPLPFGLGRIGERIEEPLKPPAALFDYAEGGSYSILVDHPSGRLAIQGSAGFVPGALEPYGSDVVLLGIGGLGGRPADYREQYYQEVIDRLSPRVVIPIHFDDLSLPATDPIVVERRFAGDLETLLEELVVRCDARPDRSLRLLHPWHPVRLF